MNELFRWIDKSEYDEGISRRLTAEEVAIGSLCKIRIESTNSKLPGANIRHLEASIQILNMRSIDLGKTAIRYIPEISKVAGQPFENAEIFDANFIIERLPDEVGGSGYLIDETDPRWDAGLKEIVDVASDTILIQQLMT